MTLKKMVIEHRRLRYKADETVKLHRKNDHIICLFRLTFADKVRGRNEKFTPKEVRCQEWRKVKFSNTAIVFCGVLTEARF